MGLERLVHVRNILVLSPALALNGFLRWFFAARNPIVAGLREFVRQNEVLRSGGRGIFRAVQSLATLQRRHVHTIDPWLRAILDARAVGGAVSVAELEKIQAMLQAPRMRVLYIAEGKERQQIEIVLTQAHAKAKRISLEFFEQNPRFEPTRFDLAIAAPVPGFERQIAHIRDRFQDPQKLLFVGTNGIRHPHRNRQAVRATAGDIVKTSRHSANEPLRVTFLNDVGFQYGAGVALKRQVGSFLLMGCEVSVVAWAPGHIIEPTFATGTLQFPNWKGILGFEKVHAKSGLETTQIVSIITDTVKALRPHLVIVGNLHGADWPIALLRNIKSLGICVVAYMHDTYFVTGRCAQPLSCTLFKTGCDARCPTADEYPALPPEQIAQAWRERELVFTGSDRVALVGNSNWTRNLAAQRFGAKATIEMVHLGLDHEMFAPIPAPIARRLLGVPDDKPVIAMGAVDVHNQWKGGPIFHQLLATLGERDDLNVVLFGQSSETLKCRKAFGLVLDERMMPLILSTADIYVSTANAESFGQSLLEASACGLPVVAFKVGGVSDIVVNNETGVLVEQQSLKDLSCAIERLVYNPIERQKMGRSGRRRVEENFTLRHQASAWVDCLKRIC
jgi:glycosyltransferase involved in cell wall biosynthesis